VRYLVLSDIHANLQALTAVLDDARHLGYDEVLVLGDLVGYGGDPGEVIDRTVALRPVAMIRGNHDKVCAGLEAPVDFNDAARASAEWTSTALTAAQLETLVALPKGPRLVTPELEICHGAPFDEDYYVFDVEDAERAIQSASARVCLFGHTHVPCIFTDAPDPPARAHGDEVPLPNGGRVIINVGSVGQPRDRDPRAAYGIFDAARSTVITRRVKYDVAGAQARIREAGLPDWLAVRLEHGA
jgi:diadenosine tetraphosphatase ApaH/serine/threonine PP2A family protein phosphatase